MRNKENDIIGIIEDIKRTLFARSAIKSHWILIKTEMLK